MFVISISHIGSWVHLEKHQTMSLEVVALDDQADVLPETTSNKKKFSWNLSTNASTTTHRGAVRRLTTAWSSVKEASGHYHNQLILALTLSVLISYADRTNMSLTVLLMMREMKLVDPTTNMVLPDREGILLAAFFCGYIVTQVPGGWAAQVWGGRRVLAAGSVIWSVCTFLIPLAATAGFWWVVLLRVGLGLGEGVCFPAIHVMISRWVPDYDKSRAVAIVTAGAYLGNIVAIGLSGELIRSPHFGWRWAFYLFGMFGLVWNFVWHMFARLEDESVLPPPDFIATRPVLVDADERIADLISTSAAVMSSAPLPEVALLQDVLGARESDPNNAA